MSEALVIRAFQNGVKAAVAASSTPDLPIKMKGRTFTPPNDQKYVEVVFIPNNQDGEFWGSEKTYQGIFRLILHWPNDDQGIYTPIERIESVASYFTKDVKLSVGDFALTIYEEPKLLGDIEAGTETLYPVSMSYRSFRP